MAALAACRTALEGLLSQDGGGLPGRQEPTTAGLIERMAYGLMAAPDEPWGLPRTLDNIHRVASTTRDGMSAEAWRTLNDFYASQQWRIEAMPAGRGEALGLLDDGLRVLAAFNGLTHENMTRSFGWTFLDLGRRLVRAHSMAALLVGIFGAVSASDDEQGRLRFTLELADSFITYRSRYRLEPMLPLLLDLLVLDESNPRSIAFQLAHIAEHVDALPQSGSGGARIEEQRMALSLLTRVRLADTAFLVKAEPNGERAGLLALLDEQSSTLIALTDAIGRRYFDFLEKGVKWVRAGVRGGR